MALTEAQISELHAILVAPVTDFDCGTLCAPENGGVPVCCHAQTILPVLYTAEFAVLERRTQLWSRYAPRNDGEREMAAAMRPCETFGICKGHEHCERENRALSCRTFPFEPYFDHDGEFAGLVFAYDLAGLCPLIGSGHRIRADFVEQCLRMFARLFQFDAEETLIWRGNSQTLRRSFARSRAKLAVYRQDGVFAYPTARTDWRRGRRDGSLPSGPCVTARA